MQRDTTQPDVCSDNLALSYCRASVERVARAESR
jgi:hypothetical protein